MISVMCSVYNSSEYLDNYCKSLNEQFLKNFEVIFVDANSTDDSVEKIKNFNFRDGITMKAIGANKRIPIYEAWNIAIKESSFPYVINYNTDDKLFKTALLTLQTYSSASPDVDIIYSDAFVSHSLDHQQLTGWYHWKDANVKENLLAGCCVGPFPLLKKKSVQDAGFFDPSFTISGDYELWCRMRAKGYKFLKIDEVIGVYYHNPQGMSTTPDAARHAEHVRQDTLIRQRYA